MFQVSSHSYDSRPWERRSREGEIPKFVSWRNERSILRPVRRLPISPPTVDGRIMPVEQYGVKVMSMGFFLQDDQAVIWRGPMLAKMAGQFIAGVEWGPLDYLIIDLPPGTGDVHLTLCQKSPLPAPPLFRHPRMSRCTSPRKQFICSGSSTPPCSA